MSNDSRAPIIGEVDFTMMYVAHEAFVRDLHRMSEAASRGDALSPSVLAGWAMFTKQLHIHHTAEDDALWPPLRAKVTRLDEIAVLDEMELEHAQIEPLLERADKAIAAHDAVTLLDTVRALESGLTAHMQHEEHEALPLVAKRLGPAGWKAFAGHIRRTQGLSGAAEYLPWLLDERPDATQTTVLKVLPPPVRLVYRAVWRPRYHRTPRW